MGSSSNSSRKRDSRFSKCYCWFGELCVVSVKGSRCLDKGLGFVAAVG